MVEGTPPGDALPPPPQRAAPARKGARFGVGAGSLRPHRRHPGHAGRGTPAARPRGRTAGGGTAPDTRRPSQQWQATPPGDGSPPTPGHAAPTGHAGQGDRDGPPHPHARPRSTLVADPDSPLSGRAVGGQGAPDLRRPSQRWKASPGGRPSATPTRPAPRGAHSPKPGRGEPGPDRPPPKHARPSKGPGQDTLRGTDHVERPYQCPVPGPREVRTPHHPGGGGGKPRRSASAHTREGHAGTTRRATGPSLLNAQTAWNGVPASEGKGHPDGTACHTQRGTRGAGRGKRERHNTRYRPEPPEPAANAAHTRTEHCTRQGSRGALHHAPTPRLGSLRASPRGSHWRQASSTGPAAPAPRATTH